MNREVHQCCKSYTPCNAVEDIGEIPYQNKFLSGRNIKPKCVVIQELTYTLSDITGAAQRGPSRVRNKAPAQSPLNLKSIRYSVASMDSDRGLGAGWLAVQDIASAGWRTRGRPVALHWTSAVRIRTTHM